MKCPSCGSSIPTTGISYQLMNYAPLDITFKGRKPEEFTDQDKKEFIEATRIQMESAMTEMWKSLCRYDRTRDSTPTEAEGI